MLVYQFYTKCAGRKFWYLSCCSLNGFFLGGGGVCLIRGLLNTDFTVFPPFWDAAKEFNLLQFNGEDNMENASNKRIKWP